MGVLFGINNTARKMAEVQVGVAGVAHDVKAMLYGDDSSVARLVWRKAKIPGIDPAYVLAHEQQGWTNPTFSSATNNNAFGGTITSPVAAYSSRAAYRLFDKNLSGSSGNWQVRLSDAGNTPITATYTLPTGKYVNIRGILMVNGYYAPVKQVEMFAGGADGVSLTGAYFTTTETSSSYKQYQIPVIADLWTNKMTVLATPPAWVNSDYTSIQEIVYSGKSLDLTPLALSNWPVYFTMEDIGGA